MSQKYVNTKTLLKDVVFEEAHGLMVGAHCHVKGQNHNKYSIGVCYEGGLDIRGQPADTRTAEQKVAMRQLLEDLHRRYPRAVIVGHHDLNHGKKCPCFDAVNEYKDLQPK